MNCDTVRDYLEEYALDLLEPDLQQAVAAHVADCPECRAIYQDYAALLAALPERLADASPYQLPGSVKVRLLQHVEAGAQTFTAATESTRVSTNDGVALPSAPSLTSSPAPAKRKWADAQPGIRRLRWALAAATLLLALSLAWTIRLNAVLARERALRAEFVELVGQQQELVLEVVDSGKTTRRVLRSTMEGSTAYGKVFTRSDMPYVVAMAARLSPPPPGQAYHLWLMHGDETELAGLMRINDDGFALIIYEAKQNDPLYDSAFVTLQAQGSATPTGDPVIAWQREE